MLRVPTASVLALAFLAPCLPAEESAAVARGARDVLRRHCHRCHGQEGAVEGGMNYVLDRDKLVARRKLLPGKADQSPLFRRTEAGEMPPPGEEPRPGPADLAALRAWIDAGAPAAESAPRRPLRGDAEVQRLLLADLEAREPRSRRFVRYFTLTHLANAGLGDDELQTYRRALAKLLNSLSWHPRLALPQPVDPEGTLLRLDLRDLMWDATLWNRLLADYPYGVRQETAAARAVLVATATRVPAVRADWFLATASRPPLYYDLLQLPGNLPELERLLRVDATANILQERVARAGFNGSGVSRNNRLLERHDAVHGAYWRTYDFEAVAQNLAERDNLLPDRRNLFAHPLGPGFAPSSFQHAGGEAIFNLPNGLHGYILVNANNLRVDKGPLAIVSDPRRPDRAVEPCLSCMSCHVTGILKKADQIREAVRRAPKSFTREEREQILALYPTEEKLNALMDEDQERYRRALEKTGNRVSKAEPVSAMALRYEADLDATQAAAEVGLLTTELVDRLGRTEGLLRTFGALRSAGGTVPRPVFVQFFGDLVRGLRGSVPLRTGATGPLLPDNTGEADPLESVSGPSNAAAFRADGRRLVFAEADRSLRVRDVEAGRDVRRLIGHAASVWAVAVTPDGRWALSGGADGTVRLWEVETGRERHVLRGHAGVVATVALTADGRRGASAGYDGEVRLWDLEVGRERRVLAAKYAHTLAFAPDGGRLFAASGTDVRSWDAVSGAEGIRYVGHSDGVVSLAVRGDGRQLVTGSDDGTARLWDTATGKEVRRWAVGVPVTAVGWSADAKRVMTGSAGGRVAVWDTSTGAEVASWSLPSAVLRVELLGGSRQAIGAGRDGEVRWWDLPAERP